MRRGLTSRRCPKCNGNIYIEHDDSIGSKEQSHGWYQWCLQCGYSTYLEPGQVLTEESKTR